MTLVIACVVVECILFDIDNEQEIKWEKQRKGLQERVPTTPPVLFPVTPLCHYCALHAGQQAWELQTAQYLCFFTSLFLLYATLSILLYHKFTTVVNKSIIIILIIIITLLIALLPYIIIIIIIIIIAYLFIYYDNNSYYYYYNNYHYYYIRTLDSLVHN